MSLNYEDVDSNYVICLLVTNLCLILLQSPNLSDLTH